MAVEPNTVRLRRYGPVKPLPPNATPEDVWRYDANPENYMTHIELHWPADGLYGKGRQRMDGRMLFDYAEAMAWAFVGAVLRWM